MKLEVTTTQCCWTILDVQGLDPINVYWHEISTHQGRIIVECDGQAWCSYWGAMGKPLMEFVRDIDAFYFASCLMAGRKHTEREAAYLTRVAAAVIAAVKTYHGKTN